VARLAPRTQDVRDAEKPRMSVAQALAIEANDRQLLEAFVEVTLRENPAFEGTPGGREAAERHVQIRASSLAAQATNAAARTLQSLIGLVRTSAQFPGRKILYFISDGFPLSPRGGEVLDRIQRAADASLRAGVVIYTVDARGLSAHMPEALSAADSGSFDPSGRLLSSALADAAATQSPLRVLAGETGGRALLNTNALGPAIGRTLKETSVYYLLAWRPEQEDGRGDRFRRLQVAVKGRPELSVLAQRGFYATPPEARGRDGENRRDPKRAADVPREAPRAGARELISALRSPLPRVGVPTALTLNYTKVAGERVVLSASLQFEIGATQPAPGNPTPTDRAELLVGFYDADGKAVDTYQREITLTPQPAAAVQPTHSVVFNHHIFVKPGLYQVRAAVRDPKTGQTGSDLQWVEIPNLARGNFALSSIFLGNRPSQADGAAADEGPQLVLAADRRFRRDGSLRFIAHIYNAAVGGAGRPDAAIQLQIFRDGQPVVTTPLKKISSEGLTDFSSLTYAAEVSLADLPAGIYSLQITAIDRVAKTSATQRAKFTID
ncbi:MAG TPA: VWA domain-containing protein, partial [Pyrinomonadaceae bacterium]|nr:VWA domain-containing protein [Pyrinomonadaceae bacterium]